MKKTFCLFLLIAGFANAQIPNAGFEEWLDNNPVGWFTLNSPGFFMPSTPSDDAHSGQLAHKGSVVDYFSNPIVPVLESYFGVQ